MKKPKTKKKGIVKFAKKKQEEKPKFGTCVSPIKSMLFSSMPSAKEKFTSKKL